MFEPQEEQWEWAGACLLQQGRASNWFQWGKEPLKQFNPCAWMNYFSPLSCPLHCLLFVKIYSYGWVQPGRAVNQINLVSILTFPCFVFEFSCSACFLCLDRHCQTWATPEQPFVMNLVQMIFSVSLLFKSSSYLLDQAFDVFSFDHFLCLFSLTSSRVSFRRCLGGDGLCPPLLLWKGNLWICRRREESLSLTVACWHISDDQISPFLNQRGLTLGADLGAVLLS